MQELTMKEIEQVNGGLVVEIIIIVGLLLELM